MRRCRWRWVRMCSRRYSGRYRWRFRGGVGRGGGGLRGGIGEGVGGGRGRCMRRFRGRCWWR